MCAINYNVRMKVNIYKNEQMLSPIHQHSTDNVCTLSAMPTRQVGNQPTHKQTTFKYECFISTDDLSRWHAGNTAENN